MAWMAWFPTRFAAWGRGETLTCLFVGRVRRWRPVKDGGVLREASLQRFHTRAELRQFVVQGVDIGFGPPLGYAPSPGA
jgi:hypothetical protein